MRVPTPTEAASYGGSVVAVISSLTLTQVGVIVGILTALATLSLNVWYTRRKDRREAMESAARLHAIARGVPVPDLCGESNGN